MGTYELPEGASEADVRWAEAEAQRLGGYSEQTTAEELRAKFAALGGAVRDFAGTETAPAEKGAVGSAVDSVKKTVVETVDEVKKKVEEAADKGGDALERWLRELQGVLKGVGLAAAGLVALALFLRFSK